MPFTSLSAAPFSESAPAAGAGRAQEPTPVTKKEQHLGNSPVPRRQHPANSSSSASSSSSSASESPPPHRSLRLHVGVFSKHKGVRYDTDGCVVKCRFCEILRERDEPFLYEDESLVVFRPLHPIVPSHILIVPRAHIRNVKQLNASHVDLLRRMRAVADRVLTAEPGLGSNQTHHGGEDEDVPANLKLQPSPGSPNDVGAAREDCPGLTLADLNDTVRQEDTSCRFAFHVPPFNSIDHVHMHAFRGEAGVFGRIKYRTESWWCRSYDEVLARLENQPPHGPTRHVDPTVSVRTR